VLYVYSCSGENRLMRRTTQINNRRYLGNKYRLLPFIKEVVSEHCLNIEVVADLFAGTGAVSSAFREKVLLLNDLLYSNYICNFAWFSPLSYDEARIETLIDEYNEAEVSSDNYMSVNFADTFFSREDCRKIGFIRENIEILFQSGRLNERERAILITALLYAMDRIAKTCGHYDAFIQGATFDQHLELAMPMAYEDNNGGNRCFNQDVNILAPSIKADLVYLDPPYNSRQYCDAYHLLENVARWQKPEVFGVARKMDRRSLKSEFCSKQAASAFERLIQSLDTRYILLSYNNMKNKGNGRSNAKISDEVIMETLSRRGRVQVFVHDYKPFSTGQSNISDNQERLFLCTVDDC